MGIGTRLKGSRETEGITLDELQETTKIQKRYLQAIEDENFGILPGTFYARAFIKEYATAVGLNAEELLEEYQEELPQTEAEETPQYTQIQRSRKSTTPAKSSAVFALIPRIIVVLLIIGILFAAWYFLKQSLSDSSSENGQEPGDNQVILNEDQESEQPSEEDQETNDTNENSSETKEDTNEDKKSEEPSEPEAELELVEEQSGGGQATAVFDLKNAPDKVTATLETTARTWLTVESDGGESMYYDFFDADNSPLELDISGKESVFIKIGHAPDVSIKINGEALEYPADPNEYVVQNITINPNN
ncbi:putative membrane protein YmfM [Lentibacillus sp. JNUCC-1]|nr:putative membrane protein YmfM [Lentibacillus sp. JNUCC-1]